MKRIVIEVVLIAVAVAVTGAVVLHTSKSEAEREREARGAGRAGLVVGPGASVTKKDELHHDTSPPLRTITPVASPPKQGEEEERLDRKEILPHPDGGATDTVVQHGKTTAVAAPAAAPVSAAGPTASANFDSVGHGYPGFTDQWAPPDINSAVGPNHVVTVVNTAFTVQSKTGTVLYGAAASNTIFSGFGGRCATTNDGDAVFRYDRAADRWVFTQFVASSPYLECVAVSTTSDPLGSWNRYSFQYANFPDYPKLAVWPDAYYVTYNDFNGNTFVGAMSCAMDRARMLAGLSATQQCFMTSNQYGGLLPADLDSAEAPPVGAPNVQLALGATSTTLAYWKFHVDWANPGNSTFTGPTALPVAAYIPACGGGTCVPQSGTSTRLDSLADRLMFRLGYRNFGDHESLVTSHAVTAGGGVGVRWYELRLSGGNPVVYQQGTYAPDASYRWMSSAAMDKAGNIGLGYTISSSSLTPGMIVTGRLAGDSLGLMTQGETQLVSSGGSQSGNLSRWGDYSSMNIDPVDDCTMWYSSEYLKAAGSFNWSTRVGSFTLPGCISSASDFSIAVSPTGGTVTQGGSATATVSTATIGASSQPVALSATGLPSGATASFLPPSVTSGGSATMTIDTSAGTLPGTYAISVNGTGATTTKTTTYTLTVNGAITGGVTNGGFETGDLTGWAAVGTNAVTTSGPYAGTYTDLSGSASPTNGDSTISQTFTVPTGKSTLSVAYKIFCADRVRRDWALITLKNVSSGTTTTMLKKSCSKMSAFNVVSATVTPGVAYTLTLTNHDDNAAGKATSTRFDNVVLG